MKQRVFVGLSGGVDSSVVALLLLQQGYAVEALFMKNWEEDDHNGVCQAAADLADARAVCDHLGIRLHTVNFASEYWDHVFLYFLAEYRAGRTPNPDILCNREIKFKVFWQHARDLGADLMATGHYVQKDAQQGQQRLLKGADDNKDQSYFLYTLNQAQLAHSVFPIGHLQKNTVRAMAKEAGLSTENKKDSTGICFIGERHFKSFLGRFLPAQAGAIVTEHGEVVGRHDGLMYYTLGQRQGLGIGGQKQFGALPWYVAAKDLYKNQLLVVQGGQHPLLFKSSLVAAELSWVSGHAPPLPCECQAKIRYRQAVQSCRLSAMEEGRLQVDFVQPQRAITAGQSVVFYQGCVCLGGGVIQEAR
jgi:tRNA-specific 2-thiouridylase